MGKELIIAVGCLTILLFCIFQYFMFQLIKSTKKPEKRLKLNYLMDILDSTIKREFVNRYKLEYELKDARMVADFQKDLKELVTATMTAFTESFLHELEFYYDRTYIIRYVTKTIEIMLIEFTNEKKIKVK